MDSIVDIKEAAPTNDEVYVFPATVGQKRFWSLNSLEPDNPALNMPLAAKLTGRLDRGVFQSALDAVVRRHEILRSSFQTEGNEVVQVVHPPTSRLVAWSEHFDLPPDRVNEVTAELMHAEAHKSFNLAKGSLLRAAVASFSDTDHLLMLTMHHIVCDGWSNGVLLRELAEHYSLLVGGNRELPADLPLQYGDYAVWQKDWLAKGDAAAQLGYWREHLGEELPILNLPTDRPRGIRPTFNGRIQTLLLPRALSEKLRGFCQQEKVTPFMLHLSAYVLLLHRYTGRRDFVVGSPAANRNQTELEGLIGLFANPLLFRFAIGPDMTFRQLLALVRDLALANFARQEYPFELVGEDLRGDRSRRGVPWLQAYFIFQKAFMQPQEMPGLHLAPLRSTSAGAMFEWMLGVLERGEGVRLQLEYNTDLFDLETVERALRHLQAIAEAAVRQPDFNIEELELDQPAVFLDSTSPVAPAPASLLERVTAAFADNAEAELLVYRNTRLTLAAWRQHAARIGGLLAGQAGGRVLRVAVGTEDALFAIAGATAICEAGHVAVPLPGGAADGTVDAILGGSLASPTLQPVAAAGAVVSVPGFLLRNDSESSPNQTQFIPAGALCQHADAVATGLRLRAGDCVLGAAPLDTVLGWEEVLACWLRGATLVCEANCDAPPAVDVSVLLLPTAWWEEMMRQKAGPWIGVSLKARLIAVDRDPVSPAAIRALGGPGPRLVQRFQPGTVGPTVLLQTLRLPAEGEGTGAVHPPARWIEGWTGTVVDQRGVRVPDGLPGRLEVQVPWLPDSPAMPSSDLVRWRNNGSFDWIGEAADLAVTPAYTLELREISGVACQHPAVWNAYAVPCVKDSASALVLHVTTAPQAGVAGDELKAFLAERMPAYMVPAAVIVHARMPLTPAGRIDYQALRDSQWFAAVAEASALAAGRSAEGANEPAQDELEKKLAALFAEMLHLTDVDVRRSFFDLGGHSLLGVKLFGRIEKEFHQRLPLATLLTTSSVRGLAQRLRQRDTGPARWSCLVPIQIEGAGPKFFCVHGAGGNVLLYRDLARHMAPNVRFYGLQALGLDGQSLSQTRIEDMAELYLREILAEQPQGPYFLGGYCMGGNIAYEIAQLLLRQGKTVNLVAMLDTYNLRKSRYSGRPLDRFRIWLQKGGFHLNTLVHLSMGERRVYLAEKLRMAGEMAQGKWQAMFRPRKAPVESDDAGGRIITFVQNANHIALKEHNPQVFAGNVALFRPRKNYFTFSDPQMGWSGLVTGRLDSIVVTSNPHAMLIEPFVRNLAKELNQRIAGDGAPRPAGGGK